jgi:hypothetical protein
MLLHLEVDDFDAWKPMFDSDPAGRKEMATGHLMSRSVDDPKGVFIRADSRRQSRPRRFGRS